MKWEMSYEKRFLMVDRSREQIWLYEPCKAAYSAEEHLQDIAAADFPQSVLWQNMVAKIIST